MYDSNQTTVYNPSTGAINTYSQVSVLDPADDTDDRFAVVGHQSRHPQELTDIFRTTDQITADLQCQLLSRGGLWIQHGHSFQRGVITC